MSRLYCGYMQQPWNYFGFHGNQGDILVSTATIGLFWLLYNYELLFAMATLEIPVVSDGDMKMHPELADPSATFLKNTPKMMRQCENAVEMLI